MIIFKFLAVVAGIVYSLYDRFLLQPMYKSRLGFCGKNVTIRNLKGVPGRVLSRVFLYDNVVMKSFTMVSNSGKLIVKQNSGASSGLVVITGNHQRVAGNLFISEALTHLHDEEKDVVIEEDVWLGYNVVLLAGVTVGRGATVGAGTVCVKSVPPYAIVMGNPAKVVGFNFTPEEIIEHEKKQYPEEERLSYELLEKNYNKYYISKISQIKQYLNN